jgi:hypothetical protein
MDRQNRANGAAHPRGIPFQEGNANIRSGNLENLSLSFFNNDERFVNVLEIAH